MFFVFRICLAQPGPVSWGCPKFIHYYNIQSGQSIKGRISTCPNPGCMGTCLLSQTSTASSKTCWRLVESCGLEPGQEVVWMVASDTSPWWVISKGIQGIGLRGEGIAALPYQPFGQIMCSLFKVTNPPPSQWKVDIWCKDCGPGATIIGGCGGQSPAGILLRWTEYP